MIRILLVLFLFQGFTATAQKHLSGLWEGELTYKGKKYKIAMQLELKSKGKLKGRVIVFEGEKKVVESDVHGRIYADRSINLWDNGILNAKELEGLDFYPRDYQLIYNRGLWENSLEGFWQQQMPELLNEKSKKGQISLKKMKPKNAKA